MDLSRSQITNLSLKALVPKEGGVGLSFLGVTNCELITSPYLQKIAPLYIFSHLKLHETFVGFQPMPKESELREVARIDYRKRLSSTRIQSVVRGVIIRLGIWRQTRNAWYGT